MSRKFKFRAYHKGSMLGDIGHHPDMYENSMQYTGLLDKNGKEIYEGDILVSREYRDSSPCEYTIEWDKVNCCFRGIGNQGDKYGPFYLRMSIGCGHDKKKFNKYIEVIGNIYENPELI